MRFLLHRFLLILTVCFAVSLFFQPQPEAKAMDPVTIAILAPIAIQGAKIMMPYVLRGLGNMAKVGLRAGKYLIHFFWLPIGLLESTLLMPWRFTAGLKHIWKGLYGIGAFVGNILLLPVAGFGIGV